MERNISAYCMPISLQQDNEMSGYVRAKKAILVRANLQKSSCEIKEKAANGRRESHLIIFNTIANNCN